MNTQETFKNAETKPDGYTLLGACALDDIILAEAFTILFDPTWKRNWTHRDKAKEMRSIIKGQTQVCRPFFNYAECIDFISRHCA